MLCSPFKLLITSLSLIAILAACEEPVGITLDNADRKLVVEGLVQDNAGPHPVKLSWLNPYGASSPPEPVTEALVIIQDDQENRDTLVQREPGLYLAEQLRGVPNRQYTLRIELEGKVYEAKDRLPPSGRLDSVLYRYVDDLTVVPDSGYYLRFYAQDDGTTKDYYLTELWQSDTLYTAGTLPYLIFDDRFAQGQYIPGFLVPFPLDSGNIVKLTFSTLSREAYDFYFGIVQQGGSGSPFGAPPSNLPTNLSNGALGFFRCSSYLYLEGQLVGTEGAFK